VVAEEVAGREEEKREGNGMSYESAECDHSVQVIDYLRFLAMVIIFGILFFLMAIAELVIVIAQLPGRCWRLVERLKTKGKV